MLLTSPYVVIFRQIHADINAMEAIIKQAEESKRIAQVTKIYVCINLFFPIYFSANAKSLFRLKCNPILMYNKFDIKTDCNNCKTFFLGVLCNEKDKIHIFV